MRRDRTPPTSSNTPRAALIAGLVCAALAWGGAPALAQDGAASAKPRAAAAAETTASGEGHESPPPLPSELLEGPGASAAEAFQAGDYAEAARRYAVLLDTRGASADLLYNAGVAWAWADDPGRAIWALERARLLEPRDEDVLANLDVMRQRVRVARMKDRMGAQGKVTDGDPEGLFVWRLLTAIRPVELAALMVLFNALGFALLALWRRRAPGPWRDAIAVGAALALLAAGGVATTAFAQALVLEDVQMGVVFDRQLRLSQAPTTTAPAKARADLYRGAVVRVLEVRSDGWLKLQLVDGTEGWIDRRHVGLVR